MKNKLHIEIITPEKLFYSGECYLVNVPSINGRVGFLPSHENFICELSDGVVYLSDSINTNDKVLEKFQISGGYAQVFNDRIEILTEEIKSIE